jgi:hypothetical protein
VVTTTNEYIIEIDENVINEKWMQDYREDFTNLKTLKDHAANIAWNRAHYGHDFYEGYGYVMQNGKMPCFTESGSQYIEKGINLIVVSENDEIEIDSEEI